MKAILFLAILVISAQAMVRHPRPRFNLKSHFFGFAEAMELEDSQMELANSCWDDLESDEKGVADLLQMKSITPTIAFEMYQLFNNLKNNIGPDCLGYFNALISEVQKRNPSIKEQPLDLTIRENLAKYAPFIIQSVFKLVGDIANGRQSNAGQAEARIFKILIGVETPEVEVENNWSAKDLKAISERKHNPTQEMKDMITGYFRATHRTNHTTLERAIKCANTQYTLIEKIKAIIQPQQGAVSGAINAMQLIEYGSRFMKDCKVHMELYEPQLKNLSKDPAHYLLTIINNAGSSIPELQRLSNEFVHDLLSGEYYEAGRKIGLIENKLNHGL